MGCLAEERFSDPVVLRVERGGRLVGLALFNRRRGRWGAESLWLHESGDRAMDAVYIEHNGMLLARDAGDLLPRCLHAVLRGTSGWGWRNLWGTRVRFAGVDPLCLQDAEQLGSVALYADSVAPYVDLRVLPDQPDAYLATLSANTRYQIRRSDRSLARHGPVVALPAATLLEAVAWFEAMAGLHQAPRTARGVADAFHNPEFLRFHRALIGRAMPRGEAELLRVTVGANVLGYLYNFCYRGRVLNYQSGFDYALARSIAGPHAKPGLSCHHAAILRAKADGATVYDFLAGKDRFKRNLARQHNRLCWFDMAPRLSGRGVAFGLRRVLRKPAVSRAVRRLGLRATRSAE